MTAVSVSNGEIIVYCDQFIKHDGYIHRTSFLLDAIHQLKDRARCIRLIFSDGEPIVFSSFATVIDYIKNTYAHNIIIEVMDTCPPYQCPGATTIVKPSPFFRQLSREAQRSNYVLNESAVLFGGIFGRMTAHRFLMSYFLETQLAQDSFVIFQPDKQFVDFELEPVRNYYTKELEWIEQRTENNRTIAPRGNGQVDCTDSLKTFADIWGKYHIEVVLETNPIDHGWFTEKTTRCLATGKPFILFGTAGQLQTLRNMGFQTFAPIDESYDREPDLFKRFNLIKQELIRLTTVDRLELLRTIQLAADYNADNYNTIIAKYYDRYTS